MPELPEVETVVRQLRPLVQGRTLANVLIYDDKLGHLPTSSLAGLLINDVKRLGKQIVFQLNNQRTIIWLAVHLRMTGRLVWTQESQTNRYPHLRARFILDRGSVQFFDPRRFGTIELAQNQSQFEPDGVDPLADACTMPLFQTLLTQGRQPIKSWLLRQDRLVGIGNIYACEALYRARIHPETKTNCLSKVQCQRLRRELRLVLTDAIESCGTTFSDFQNAHGVTGSYQNYLRVYGRENLPCPRCARKIRRTLNQGRSTFYCAYCQRRTKKSMS